MQALLSFAAALISLRLAGDLRSRGRLVSAGALFAYAVACGALAWGTAHGWDTRFFRVYYLTGGLLTAPFLGAGSLQLVRRGWAGPLGLAWVGLAAGVARRCQARRVCSGIPAAQYHVD